MSKSELINDVMDNTSYDVDNDNKYCNINQENKVKWRNKSARSVSEVKNKINYKIKSLQKDAERRNRLPSIRLGKNAKKQAGRLNLVLNQEDEKDKKDQDNELLVDIPETTMKDVASRISLCRLKRKPSHRERRPETINFHEENPLEYLEQGEDVPYC
jgi:hypothetical protein